METFFSELELLQASYSSHEMEHFVSNNSSIIKFTINPRSFVTFEIGESYPQEVAAISISTSEMANLEKFTIEQEVRNYALQLVGEPMIMDIVTKVQELFRNHSLEKYKENQTSLLKQENYLAVIIIDHMRHRRKYSKTLLAWASELDLCGILLFCQKWIFLVLEGLKNKVKEFIIRHKTIPIDVDSNGKPCKEKMSKVIFEGPNLKLFTSFETEEFSNIESMENYFNERNLSQILVTLKTCYKM